MLILVKKQLFYDVILNLNYYTKKYKKNLLFLMKIGYVYICFFVDFVVVSKENGSKIHWQTIVWQFEWRRCSKTYVFLQKKNKIIIYLFV